MVGVYIYQLPKQSSFRNARMLGQLKGTVVSNVVILLMAALISLKASHSSLLFPCFDTSLVEMALHLPTP